MIFSCGLNISLYIKWNRVNFIWEDYYTTEMDELFSSTFDLWTSWFCQVVKSFFGLFLNEVQSLKPVCAPYRMSRCSVCIQSQLILIHSLAAGEIPDSPSGSEGRSPLVAPITKGPPPPYSLCVSSAGETLDSKYQTCHFHMLIKTTDRLCHSLVWLCDQFVLRIASEFIFT